MNLLYQAAIDAAQYARKVYEGYYKRNKPEVGVTIEPSSRVSVELGYTRKWKVEGIERKEFHTSKHLNMAIEAHIAKHMETIVATLVQELEAKATKMACASRDQLVAELAMIDALRATQPKGAA